MDVYNVIEIFLLLGIGVTLSTKPYYFDIYIPDHGGGMYKSYHANHM